jgi:hypothetical protein
MVLKISKRSSQSRILWSGSILEGRTQYIQLIGQASTSEMPMSGLFIMN